MKNLVGLLAFLLIGSNALAAQSIYRCTLQGDATPEAADAWIVVKSPTDVRVTWMPAANLKTTKANAEGPIVQDDGSLEFTLFAFQDTADLLVLPKEVTELPKNLHLYTYVDNDDHPENRQDFDCMNSTK